jgi:hypothetical protein
MYICWITDPFELLDVRLAELPGGELYIHVEFLANSSRLIAVELAEAVGALVPLSDADGPQGYTGVFEVVEVVNTIEVAKPEPELEIVMFYVVVILLMLPLVLRDAIKTCLFLPGGNEED